MKDIKKPNSKLFILGAIVIAGGILVSIVLFFLIITKINVNSYKFVAPSEVDVFLEEGTYTVYYEYQSEFEGVKYFTGDNDVQGLNFNVINKDTYEEIEVNIPSGTSTYNVNGSSAYAILSFKLEEDTSVIIETTKSSDSEIVLNINGGIVGTILISVFILIFGIGISVVVGLVIILLTSSKLTKYNKMILDEQKIKEKKKQEKNSIKELKTSQNNNISPLVPDIINQEEVEDESVLTMWADYIDKNNLNEAELSYEAWSFGSHESMARELADLVVKGKKRGTTSLFKMYEVDQENLPKIGELSIIIDWIGKAKCIIKTTDVTIKAFNQVDEAFAKTEGEGDGSLYFWKKVHKEAFESELKPHGLIFTEDLKVVCETFEVVFK